MDESNRKARIPVQKRGIETRDRIIEAAMELVSEKGYYKTGVPEIASRAGMATGTFYSYFNDKKEVLLAGVERFYRDVTRQVLSAAGAIEAAGKNGRDFIHALLRAFYAAHAIHPRLHRELSALILLDRDVEELNRREEEKAHQLIRSLLEDHGSILSVEDLDAASFILLRITDEIIHRLQFFDPPVGEDRVLGELEEMLCRYLLRELGSRKTGEG